MKKFSKILISLFSVIIFVSTANIGFTTADGSDIYVVSTDDSRFSYCLNADGTLKVKASLDVAFKEKLTIPERLDGKAVTAIADRGFVGQQLITELVIPITVTNIGSSAFTNSYKLEKVDIKGKITDIGAYPFFACPFENKLKKIGNFVILSDDILYDYTGTSPSIEIPSGIRVISGNLFTHVGFDINSVIIPDSVESVCGGAFYDCKKLQTVTFGSGIKNIGANAFNSPDVKFSGYYDTAAQKYANENGFTFEPLIEYGKTSETVYADFSDKFRQYYFTDEKDFSREGVLVYKRNYNGEKVPVNDWQYSAKLTDIIPK